MGALLYDSIDFFAKEHMIFFKRLYSHTSDLKILSFHRGKQDIPRSVGSSDRRAYGAEFPRHNKAKLKQMQEF